MSAIVYFTNKEPPQVYTTMTYGCMDAVAAGFMAQSRLYFLYD